jgi:hypothetical protein
MRTWDCLPVRDRPLVRTALTIRQGGVPALTRRCPPGQWPVSGDSARGRIVATMQTTHATAHPVRFSVDYPDRPLDRVSTAFRLVLIVPIVLVLAAVSGTAWQWTHGSGAEVAAGAGGLLTLGPLVMIVFRRTYPRWWFDWNLELQRFTNRVWSYALLMDDRYPSTTEQQSVHLDYDYADPAAGELNRWLPLVKWFLAIPHYVALVFLGIGAALAVVAAWFVVLFTGRYPKRLFRYVEGVLRWGNRVTGYAVTLVTDRYPPFRLAP